MPGYRDLKVWQAAMRLAEDAYRLTSKFPKHETYGLASQLQRAAVSIPSNIAEGHGRNSSKEFHHFLGISMGSLAELETQLVLAQRFAYLTEDDLEASLKLADEIAKNAQRLAKIPQL